MASAIIIDIADVLTDEERNDQEAIALVRQIVATAGQRVSEEALRKADSRDGLALKIRLSEGGSDDDNPDPYFDHSQF